MNGGFSVPVLQGSFTFGVYHSICPRIKEILADAWAGFVFSSGDYTIDNADGIEFFLKHMCEKNASERLGSELCRFSECFSLLKFGKNSVSSAKVFLPLDLNLPLDTMDFTKVPIGPTIKYFFGEICHIGIILYRFYIPRQKI